MITHKIYMWERGIVQETFSNYCQGAGCTKKPVVIFHGMVSLDIEKKYPWTTDSKVISIRTPLCHEHANDIRIFEIEKGE